MRSLLAPHFVDVEAQDLTARVQVPTKEIAAWLGQAYYPVDALSDEGKATFAAFLADQSSAAPGGTMAWTFHMRRVSAVRRP
ncbi:MAG: hypothetical protein H0V89_04485 [Deltaproteobacteria bacterium]|nr:hypothetical protein [Deltaproteobacteria bacterium]